MLKMNTVVAAQATTAIGAAQEQSATPYLEGTSVVALMHFLGFSGTAILEGSDDGVSWSTLHTSGSLTTSSDPQIVQITLPKYVRHNTTRTAGSVSMYILNAG